MLARLTFGSARFFAAVPDTFRFPSTHGFHVTSDNAEVFVRRVVKCVRERLLQYDPHRWEGVELSYNSNWLCADSTVDVATAIQVHEALEKEFKIEVMDQRILVTDMKTACAVVAGSHDAI